MLDNKIKMVFSCRLANLRKEKGQTQAQLAHGVGLSQEEISRYELGKDVPSFGSLVKLAQVLETTTDCLLGLTDPELAQATPCESLNSQEQELINSFRSLCPSARQRAIGYIQGTRDHQ